MSDWLDPETWRIPAALAENWQKIAVGVVTIGGAIGTVLRWGFAPVRWVWAQLHRDRNPVGPKPEHIPAGVLQMQVRESGPFFQTTGRGVYDIKRTFNIKLSNIDSTKTAANCKVHITKIEPQTEYEGPWTLTQGLTLAAGDHEFIPLATFEARNPNLYNCADSFFTLHVEGHCPLLDADKNAVLTLRATAIDTPMSEIRCKLWVGSDGRFHVEQYKLTDRGSGW